MEWTIYRIIVNSVIYVNNTPVQSMAEKMIQMVGEDEEGYVSFPAFFRIYLDVHHRVHSLHPLCARMRHRTQPVANSPTAIYY